MNAAGDTQTYNFRDFELDLGAHQLRLRGEPVHLERRPFELLVLLVSRHGNLVPRDEIIALLWPGKVVIDFDTGLNTLVRKVRQALGDSPDSPAFIETVAGSGYRFIAPVTRAAAQTEPAARPAGKKKNLSVAKAVLIIAATVAVSVGIWRGFTQHDPRIGIVVMPFENLTGDDTFDYLAAGLAEDTRASLSQIDINNLRMIGRVSAEAFAASDKSPAQIGRELGVDFVVTSSLRAEQSKIRVTTTLVRVVNNEQVWTATFDRELTSILGLQRELSSAIAEQVRLQLSPEVAAAMTRRQTPDPEAYDLFLQGRYQWSQLSPLSSRRALEYYDRAIARDPEYALAWAGIAQVLSTAPITGDADPVFVRARATDAVQRAVQSGSELTEVQYALGHYHFILNWDWPAAENALRRAAAIDPNNALAFLFLGHVRSQSGDHVEARSLTRRARELDPLFSHTFALSSQVAFQARDYDSALEFARQAIAINPDGWVGYVQLGQTLAELGDYAGAIAAYDDAALLSGDNSKAVAYRAHALASSGRSEEALEVATEMEAKAHEQYVSPSLIALIYAGLGANDAAMEWLERAYAVRDVHLVFLPVDARWDPLRDDPRFQSLLTRCRFCGDDHELVDGRCQPAQPSETSNAYAELIHVDTSTQQTVASANIDGIWTATPTAIGGDGTVRGLVTFTGPEGKLRQMGMCMARLYGSPGEPVACETVDDCALAPAELAPGGSRYCVASQSSETKYCHYRPGERSSYCAASPAQALMPVPAGTYHIDLSAEPGSQWRALACFNVCVSIPPAIGELVTVR